MVFERHPAQPGEPYPSALALAGTSILIVEDEPLIAMSVESGLQDAGAAVVKILQFPQPTASSTQRIHLTRR